METVVKTPNKKTVTSLSGLVVDSANRKIMYFDGLGRSLQMVQWQGSPTKKEFVQSMVYDALGRESIKYLPYIPAIENVAGNYKAGNPDLLIKSFYNPEGSTGIQQAGGIVRTSHPYSVTVFEASPLSRVQEQGEVGLTWQPATNRTITGRTTVTDYGGNNNKTTYTTSGFAVRLYTASIVSPIAESYKNIIRYGTFWYQ